MVHTYTIFFFFLKFKFNWIPIFLLNKPGNFNLYSQTTFCSGNLTV